MTSFFDKDDKDFIKAESYDEELYGGKKAKTRVSLETEDGTLLTDGLGSGFDFGEDGVYYSDPYKDWFKDLTPLPNYVFSKTVGTFAQVIGKKINLVHDNAESRGHYMYTSKKDEITINIDLDDNFMDHYTALEHEISHALFNTPNKSWNKLADQLIKDLPHEIHAFAKHVLHAGFNILEDMRIESLYGQLYLGSKRMFEEERKKIGQDGKRHANDPINAMLCDRFFRPDLVEKSKYKDIGKYNAQVCDKSARASLITLIDLYNDHLKAWIIEQGKNYKDLKKMFEKIAKEVYTLMDESAKKSGEMKSLEAKLELNPEDSELLKHLDILRREIDDIKKATDKSLKDKEEALEKLDREEMMNARKIRELTSGKPLSLTADTEKDGFEFNLDSDKKKELEKAIEEAKKELAEIKRKLDDIKTESNKPEKLTDDLISVVKREEQPFNINYKLAKELKHMFREIKEAQTQALNDEGTDLDLDEMIQQRIKKGTEYFMDEDIKGGLDIVLAVDLSGSMESEVKHVRDLSATFMYALSGIKDINFKVLGWSSPSNHYGVSVTEISELEGCKQLTIKREHVQNANGLAMLYAGRMVKKMKGTKKIILMLTDGDPACVMPAGSGRMDLKEWTKNDTESVIKKGIEVFGIYFGSHDVEMDNMIYMYKDKIVQCKNFDNLQQTLVKEIKKIVVEQLKK